MKPLTWNIGNVTITSIVEVECGSVIHEVIPNATKENIKKIPWLVPHFADAEGNLKAVVQSFVVRTSDKVILIDACVGNGKVRSDIKAWNNLQTDFLIRLEEAGFKPEDITHVFCTHLHFDHVGWNTKLENGKWVPTFPKAKYLFAQKEFDYWKTNPEKEIADDKAGFVDSVLPIVEAGLHELVPVDYKLCDGVSLIPTPGHTPAHCSVLISSEGKQAVITGDVFHHPCQIVHPEWETVSDTDPKQAVETRKEFLERFANKKTIVIGSHFAEPTAIQIRREQKSFTPVFRMTKVRPSNFLLWFVKIFRFSLIKSIILLIVVMVLVIAGWRFKLSSLDFSLIELTPPDDKVHDILFIPKTIFYNKDGNPVENKNGLTGGALVDYKKIVILLSVKSDSRKNVNVKLVESRTFLTFGEEIKPIYTTSLGQEFVLFPGRVITGDVMNLNPQFLLEAQSLNPGKRIDLIIETKVLLQDVEKIVRIKCGNHANLISTNYNDDNLEIYYPSCLVVELNDSQKNKFI